ncbi:MAG: peptidylprolyl isomerase [Hyphomicrobiales bacterium]|nr:MAG: peptidylprolyl isomerase [Hyphomicrobiales bacterium]
MLDALRRGTLNLFAKGLLALLVVAFAVWGIGDVVRNVGRDTVATIGSVQITPDEVRQAYQDEMDSMTRRFGRRLTPAQAQMLGVQQRALSRLIGGAAIAEHARSLGLAISDQGLADMIKQDPAFQGTDGQFNVRAFQSYLRQAGMNEARFISERRKEEIRDQITDTLLATVSVPQWMIDVQNRYRNETRVAEYFTPDYDKVIKVPEPDEARLKTHYEQNLSQYMTPELRKINLLTLARAPLMAKITVSDDDIKAAFERDQDKYNVPEKRRIQQIAFDDKAAAEKAYAELSKAKNFTEAATKLGFKESDYDLGVLARKDMIDGKAAAAAFALKKDEVSKPVEGDFKTVILRVTEIVAGKQRSLADVKNELIESIKADRATDQIRTLHDKVDDARGSGKLLKEIGSELGIPFQEGIETDRSGKTLDGKPALEGPEAARIAQGAFAATQGVETEPVELSDGGYAWFDFVSTTPAKQKPFDAVKAEVVTQVKDEERRREISQLAVKLVDRINAGESVETLAKETFSKVEKSSAFTRNTSPQGLPAAAVQQAFLTAKGRAASAVSADRATRVVLKVVDIIPAPAVTPEVADRFKADLLREMQSDALAEYVGALQARYGLRINEAALRQALGDGAGSDQGQGLE